MKKLKKIQVSLEIFFRIFHVHFKFPKWEQDYTQLQPELTLATKFMGESSLRLGLHVTGHCIQGILNQGSLKQPEM